MLRRTVTTLNGNGASAAAAAAAEPLAVLEAAASVPVEAAAEPYLEPCEAGQLEACATERIMSSMDEVQTAADAVGSGGAAAATLGTPYASPGGRWANFQQYSIFQVRVPHHPQVWLRPELSSEGAHLWVGYEHTGSSPPGTSAVSGPRRHSNLSWRD